MGVTETGLMPNPFVSRAVRSPNPFDGVLSDEALDDGPDSPLSPNPQPGEARAATPVTTEGNTTELNFTDAEVDVVEGQPEGTEQPSQGSEGLALVEALARRQITGIDWSSLELDSASLTELLNAEEESHVNDCLRSTPEARQEGGIPAPYLDIEAVDPDVSLRPREPNSGSIPVVDTIVDNPPVDMEFSEEPGLTPYPIY